MTFFEVWVISAVLAGLGMICIQAWEIRHNKLAEPVTLLDVIKGLALATMPGINTLAALVCILHMVFEISPKVIVFKKTGPEHAKAPPPTSDVLDKHDCECMRSKF